MTRLGQGFGGLLIATTNPNKIREIRPVLADLPIELITLADVDPIAEPEETGATFWENARIKALAYAAASNHIAVAEDSGLEVDALGGEPGVQSARFLGANSSYAARFEEIFRRLGSKARDARFVTALSVASGSEILFETETAIAGVIAEKAIGDHGFGYDPIFFYPPLGCTTAQLIDADKAAVSHRARAFRDLHIWLRTKSAIGLFRLGTNT
ncbi:MAG TPA: RdgB/HAM1 family non-canonical purine NTP pyrophosphatase [Vicinamibacterales bacterium]|nr:RdgB/HAM1 family non-canonical purine NTP pyrophosphatase [Vicinamibacterales bacterium]